MKGVKKLEDWITFPEAAKFLGVSREGFRKMIDEQGLIPCSKIRAVGDKPTYIVRTEAIHALKKQRDDMDKLNAEMKIVLEEALRG